jgi:hypothetical protein
LDVPNSQKANAAGPRDLKRRKVVESEIVSKIRSALDGRQRQRKRFLLDDVGLVYSQFHGSVLHFSCVFLPFVWALQRRLTIDWSFLRKSGDLIRSRCPSQHILLLIVLCKVKHDIAFSHLRERINVLLFLIVYICLPSFKSISLKTLRTLTLQVKLHKNSTNLYLASSPGTGYTLVVSI